MRRQLVYYLIEGKYRRYASEVIEQIKALGPECRLSGDDSGLADVWEEWKSQMQEEHSIYFDAYEDTILGICRSVVQSLPKDEQSLLWLQSDAYFDWDEDEEDPPSDQELQDALTQELYARVCQIAADEEISRPTEDDGSES